MKHVIAIVNLVVADDMSGLSIQTLVSYAINQAVLRGTTTYEVEDVMPADITVQEGNKA